MTSEAELIARLVERGWLLALAESCTGGLVSARLTSVPGASAVFLGGVICYANAIKRDILDVPETTLKTAGAVSTETAMAMAQSVRRIMHAHLAAAITGIAGPEGGTAAKPVGLVFIAIAGPRGEHVARFVFSGDRAAIRSQAADAALHLLLEQTAVTDHEPRCA